MSNSEARNSLRVVVHTLGNGNSWGWVNVTGKQRVDVVLLISNYHDRHPFRLTAFPCRALTMRERSGGRPLRCQYRTIAQDQCHVPSVSGTSGLLVGVRTGHVIGKLSSVTISDSDPKSRPARRRSPTHGLWNISPWSLGPSSYSTSSAIALTSSTVCDTPTKFRHAIRSSE